MIYQFSIVYKLSLIFSFKLFLFVFIESHSSHREAFLLACTEYFYNEKVYNSSPRNQTSNQYRSRAKLADITYSLNVPRPTYTRAQKSRSMHRFSQSLYLVKTRENTWEKVGREIGRAWLPIERRQPQSCGVVGSTYGTAGSVGFMVLSACVARCGGEV